MIKINTIKLEDSPSLGTFTTDDLTGVVREIPKPYEVYRHFKGDMYVIIDIATHTETGETLVIYGRENKTWARPLTMFLSEVDHEKYPDVQQNYRFERC